MAKDFDSPAMPSIKPIPEPPDPRVIPLDRQEPLTHNQVEQLRFGLGDTGPLAQAVMNANVPALAKQLATGAVQCLSTRRPADPVVGQMIFETDTKLSYFWDGTAWVTGTGSGSGAILTPVGAVVPYAGTDSSTPAGWLFCGGQTVSQTTYAALFAVISTTYNTGGEAAGDFRIPDLRGRVAAGKDNMGGTAANRLTNAGSGIIGTTLGANGGGQTQTLSLDHVHYGQGQGGNIAAAIGAVNSRVDSIGYIAGGVTGPGSGTSTYAIAGGYLGTGNAFNHYTPVYGQTSGMSANSAPVVNRTQPTLITNYIIKAIPDTVTGYAGTTLTGAAGGDLAGSYPSPAVAQLSNTPIHNSNTTLSFRTSGTERMSIDASGRMCRPFQPVCQLYNQTGRNPDAAMGWTGTYVNTGSMWDGSTRVTVPIAGTYLVTYEGMSWNDSAAAYFMDLFRNGSWIATARQYTNTGSRHDHISMHVYISCGANDFFQWVPRGVRAYSDTNGYQHASVALFA